MEKLHPGARWVFRFRAYSSFIFLVMILFFFSLSFLMRGSVGDSKGSTILSSILIVLLIAIILVVIIGEIYARMAYDRWFYEFTKDSLKLERGIIWKKYSNVPYERVQNVDIHRGILARMLGFSSVMIQTAGYSGTGRGMATEGYLPAVDIDAAEKIRDFLMKKISKRSHAGL